MERDSLKFNTAIYTCNQEVSRIRTAAIIARSKPAIHPQDTFHRIDPITPWFSPIRAIQSIQHGQTTDDALGVVPDRIPCDALLQISRQGLAKKLLVVLHVASLRPTYEYIFVQKKSSIIITGDW